MAGVFSGEAKWMVGWAMVARGEFAYLVAESAQTLPFQGDTSRKMMTAEVYASVSAHPPVSTRLSPPARPHPQRRRLDGGQVPGRV